jgi:zinc/manganese transport system substrate-binding protein
MLTGTLMLASCATGNAAAPTDGKLHVLAAESFWGNIAAQLGGDKVAVKSVISNPNTDPHDYEATPSDARAVASAQYVVYNGFGYDPWTGKLLDSNPSKARLELKVQSLLGLKNGDNPHRWYSPDDVLKVVEQMTSDYKRLDPADAEFFDARRTEFVSHALKDYTALVQEIRQRYGGTAVGATESIVAPMAEALGLNLVTPYSFLQAISEGTDPTAQDKATADRQIASKQIAVLLFNTQNATPDVQRLVDAAKANGIHVVDVTETLEPPGATFQDWQTGQLRALANALAAGVGK